MTLHVLDTAAVYHLVNWQTGAFRRQFEASEGDVRIPALVMLEAEQSSPLPKKRLEGLNLYAAVDERLPLRLLQQASEALRRVQREKCAECGGLTHPTLVDAVVAAYAENLSKGDEQVVVHTDDVDDLSLLLGTTANVEVRKL